MRFSIKTVVLFFALVCFFFSCLTNNSSSNSDDPSLDVLFEKGIHFLNINMDSAYYFLNNYIRAHDNIPVSQWSTLNYAKSVCFLSEYHTCFVEDGIADSILVTTKSKLGAILDTNSLEIALLDIQNAENLYLLAETGASNKILNSVLKNLKGLTDSIAENYKIRALCAKVNNLHYEDRIDEAIRNLELIKNNFDSISNYNNEILLLLDAKIKRHQGLIDSADIQFTEIANNSQFKKIKLKVLQQLGDIADIKKRQRKNLLYWLEALALAYEYLPNDSYELAINLHATAFAYYNIGDIEKAIEYAKETELIYQNANFLYDYAWNLINIGTMYIDLELYVSALRNYKKALPIILDMNNPPDIYSLYDNIGALYGKMNMIDSSYFYYTKVIELKRENESVGYYHPSVVNSLVGLGSCYLNVGSIMKAEEYFNEAHEIINKLEKNSSIVYSTVYAGLAEIDLIKGDYRNSLINNQIAINKLIPSLDTIAGISLQSQNIDLKSLILSRSNLVELLAHKLKCISALPIESANYTEGVVTYKIASQLIDSLRNTYDGEMSKIILLENAREIFGHYIILNARMHDKYKEDRYLEYIFNATERSKAILLSESINDAESKLTINIPNKKVQEEALIKWEVSQVEKNIFDEESKPIVDQNIDSLKNYKRKRFELKRKYEDFVASLEREFPAYYNAKYNLDFASVKDLQNNLDTNTLAIQFFLEDTICVILGITKDKIIPNFVPLDSTLERSIEELIQLVHNYRGAVNQNDKVQQRSYERFVEVSHLLYTSLLEPLVTALGSDKQKLLIFPDGKLGYIPFEILLTQPPAKMTMDYRNLAYLIKEYDIHYEYSATLLLQSAKRSRNYSKGLLAYAPDYEVNVDKVSSGGYNPLFATIFSGLRDGLEPLKYNKEEVQKISRSIGGNAHIAQFAQASHFKANASDYQVLHLAMHAFTNDVSPKYSHLVFSETTDSTEDRLLHAYELYNMRLNADLAVLSACETGAGELKKGEGIMSLARAFKYAGCPNIVTSLWKADDETAKKVMVDFYKNLKQGMGKAEALRMAKLNALDNLSSQAYAHPFYWATFVLIGDNQPLDIKAGTPIYFYLLIGVALLALLLFFMRNRKNTTSVASR